MTSSSRIFTRDFVVTCVLSFAVFSGFYLMLSVLPTYVSDLGGDTSAVGLIGGIFATSAMFFRPVVGSISDKAGRVPLIRIGAFGAILASAGYLFAGGILQLLAVRIAHGAGFSATSTGGSALIGDIAPKERRGEAVGYYGMVGNLALAMMPAAGIFLYNAGGYRALFISSVVCGVVAFGAAMLLRQPAAPPPAPTLTVRPSGGFIVPEALIPAIVGLTMSSNYGAIVTFLPLYLRERPIADPSLFYTAYALVVIIGRGFLGKISDRYGRSAAIVPGMLIGSIAMVFIAEAPDAILLAVGAVLFGIAMSLSQPALNALVIDRVPAERRGAALGMFIAAFDLGIGGGSFLWGYIVKTISFEWMYLIAAIFPVLGMAVLLVSEYRRSRPASHA